VKDASQSMEQLVSTIEAKPPKHRKMGCGTVLLVITVISALCGAWGYWLWKSEPVYWQEHKQYLEKSTPQERLALAESVERRVLDKISFAPVKGPMGGGDGTASHGGAGEGGLAASGAETTSNRPAKTTKEVFLTIEEINAWMDQRLKDWASNQGMNIPDFVKDPMVAIEDDYLILAFKFEKPPISQVVSVMTTVVIEENEAKIQVEGVRGGRLKIPGVKAAANAVGARGGESGLADIAAKITKAFDGKTFNPLLKLNSQKIRMISFELKPDGALLTLKPAAK